MKPLLTPTSTLSLAGLALALLGSTGSVEARPYATCLTNNAGVISFRLNESADNVKIIWNGGATTNDLGALPKGLTVTANLGVTGSFKVQVAKAGGAGYLQGVVNQISDDANTLVKFTNQRGVAINKRPASPYFGRVYVSVATAATTGGRSIGEGIYLLNADQTDAVGQGNTARTGGLVFDSNASSGSESPYRLFVGSDDSLYIADWSDSKGCLYVTDPDVATNSAATNVLDGIGGPSAPTFNHGSIASAYVEGSLAGGDLVVYTQDEDLAPKNGVFRYDINAGPLPWAGAGTQVFAFGQVSQVAKILRGPDGKWYGSNRRADNATTAGVFVLSADGTTPLWDSLTAWREFTGNTGAYDDFFSETRGFDVSPDGKYLVTFKGATNIANKVAANSLIVVPLSEGIPNLQNMMVIPTPGGVSIGRELSFDAAGNIYTVSSGQGLLRIYGPGGYAVTTTGSDGSFAVYTPAVDVTVTANDSVVSEGSAGTQFVFSRPALDVTQPLAVNFQVSGTAVRGTDYVLKTNGVTLTTERVTIPAGQASVAVTIAPIQDTIAEPTETVTLSVTVSQNYTVGTPGVATVAIADDEPATIVLSPVYATMYEGNPFDYVQVQLTRLGDTNTYAYISASDFTFSGTAQSGVDFAPNLNGPDPFNFGDVTKVYNVASPLQDVGAEGPETFSVGLNSGFGFVAATNTVLCTIIDDEVASGPIAFAETFNNPASSNLWSIKFAARNGIDDYTAAFGYDYSALGVPAAPNGSGDTMGLFLTVNKSEGTALGGAGINAYPIGKSFSGDYAVRFDMYLIQNTGCAGTTEYALFGINHSGTLTNWFRNNTDGAPGYAFDGLFYQIEADAGALGDYVLNTSPAVTNAGVVDPTALGSASASSFEGIFKAPPFSAAGAPANPNSSTTPSWVQVEIASIGNLVTLKLNNTVIMTTTNNTAFKSGNLMLGYDDAYDSIGCNGGVIYDNLRVISYLPFNITKVTVTGGNVELSFTDSGSGPYTVEASTNAGAGYGTVAATITGSGGNYLAKVPYSAGTPARFYRIKR